ncbi:MAG TPA: UDP-4-amino-4,6-dideoxy-N-acetyl-beta-L-altrosamine transaminase [Rhodocyclaceae bacterium]|nr:UDP-4-amino-4,6-dideoxy-N-acetyl-beta-L-altrosamine transaminase [Rhodocyclaceae bacterium]
MSEAFIPYGCQDIGEADVAAVLAVLQSDWLTQGPAVPAFEAAVAGRCGVPYGVAACNATAALHIACLALGVGPGDLVWTSPNTFVASANCARYCGADVDFVDIDPATLNLDVRLLEAKLEAAAGHGRLPKVVIPVHFAGQPCDMARLAALGETYGFRIIEDASHAIGATYQGEPVGNCRYSDITVFSFHPVKIVTTAEGGMAMTRDAALAQTLAELRSHGITREASRLREPSHGPWYYEQIALGFNYRLTDLQAALGTSQLARLDQFLARRHELVARYDRLLADLPVTRPHLAPGRTSAWHLYCIRVDAARRAAVFDALRTAGIGANVHYIPVHTQPDYRRLGFAWGDFPVAEQYYREAITLPLHPRLTDEQQDRVVRVLAGALA